MEKTQPSTTAEIVAFFRALESAQPADRRLFHDPLAAGFLRPWLRSLARGSAWPLIGPWLVARIDARWPGARTSGIARTRLIDDWVRDATASNARQALILGAGFDSRAWRLAALRQVPVFEVDHPATSAAKQLRLAAMGAALSRVTFIPVDFEQDRAPEALAKAGFDWEKPAVVIWEGVTNYLTADAVAQTLRWIASLAPTTRLIFTYVHEGVLTQPADFEGAPQILLAVTGTGEPWTFGVRPEALPGYLQQHGFRLIEDLGANDYRVRYFGDAAKRMRGYEFYRVALAEVIGVNS